MKALLRALSDKAEFSIVVLIAFGYFILGSVLSVLAPAGGGHIGESNLQFLLVYETIVFCVLWGFLYLRGWRFAAVGLAPSLRDSLVGVGIAMFLYLVYNVLWILFGQFIPGLHQHAAHLVTPNLSLITVLSVSVLNPVFEEVFVCGYLITALRKKRSLTFAVNVSIAVRMAYHLYQGSIGVFNIIPLGIVYAYWFARTGRLWPLVIAHGLFDFLAMVYYVKN